MSFYEVQRLRSHAPITVEVPASKSILNRSILLAMLAKGTVTLSTGEFAEDTEALLNCLSALGISYTRNEDTLSVCGCGGKIPVRNAELNVGSAGTAARFLSAVLAVCGGQYLFTSSEQMERRPMEILSLLEKQGVKIQYLKERGHFPFRMVSNGIGSEIEIDTDESTQYASGLLIAAAGREEPLYVRLTGSRTQGSYIKMTLALLSQFQVPVSVRKEGYVVKAPETSPASVTIEPDFSAACYFYALSLLLSMKVLVKGVHRDSLQGDSVFLRLLTDRGVILSETPEGLLADGSRVREFCGFDEVMTDFSDQTLTVAALAPFATTRTILKGVSHIKKQECDRIFAITSNLSSLGVPARSDGDTIYIEPAHPRGGDIKTFQDHRVAMAFTLLGLRTGNIRIENPACCKKTFPDYFEIIDRILKS